MKRLDRYMVKEMVVPFLIGQGAVVLMLTGTVLYNNADTFLNYQIPALGIAKLAFCFMPYLVSLTMPVAMAIAASLAISRLARDTEITVMRAAGISLKRIFFPIMVLGFVVSIADFFFGERVVPWATAQYQETITELSSNLPYLSPKPQQVVQSEDGKFTAQIGRIEVGKKKGNARLFDVMLIVNARSRTPTVVFADTADYQGGVWTLRKARALLYEDGGRREKFIAARDMTINFRLAERSLAKFFLTLPLYSDAAAKSFAQVAAEVAQQRRTGWVSPYNLLDLHFKLSVPFSCLVFAIACPPLALRFARAGNFMGVLLSIILVFVYWNTLLASKIIGSRFPNLFPPAVAGWGQNVLFSAIGLYFLWRGE